MFVIAYTSLCKLIHRHPWQQNLVKKSKCVVLQRIVHELWAFFKGTYMYIK